MGVGDVEGPTAGLPRAGFPSAGFDCGWGASRGLGVNSIVLGGGMPVPGGGFGLPLGGGPPAGV